LTSIQSRKRWEMSPKPKINSGLKNNKTKAKNSTHCQYLWKKCVLKEFLLESYIGLVNMWSISISSTLINKRINGNCMSNPAITLIIK